MRWPFARPLVDLQAAPEAPPERRAIGVIRAVQKAPAMYGRVRLGRHGCTSAALIVALMLWPFARPLVDLQAAPEAPPEMRAIGVIRAVQKAQAMYRAAFGYYDRLECLLQASCVPNPYPPS